MASGKYDGVGSSRDYKRGAIMGLTVAEAFILLTFVLLLLFTWWQVESEKKNLDVAEQIADLTDEEKRRIVAGLSDGTFDLALRLRQAGMNAGDEVAIADTSNYTRFMREEDLKRLLNGAVELEPGTRISLADAVEITPETRLRAALEDLMRPDETTERINKRLADAAADQERVVDMLNEELGPRIREAGGDIDANGTITLPQNILFEASSAEIRNKKFLREFCTPWISALRNSGLDISEVKIEGHASSEGQSGQAPAQAYLYNLDLSQKRAQNALEVCLRGLKEPELLDWARAHLAAAGYSSARPIRDESGAEDREASRRVMFSIGMDRERLIDEIRKDLGNAVTAEAADHSAETARPRSRPEKRETSPAPEREEASKSRITRVIDGDTLAIGGERWRLSGIDAPEIRQQCARPNGDVYACGEASRDALIALIGGGVVECEEVDRDRYGRSVGICRVNGRDLGEDLVSAGMAVAYLEYSDAYEQQGFRAKSERRGLWSGEFEPPAAFRKAMQ
ncbi:thermonuclease family protein [Paracoccus methylarcula]|uniref:OmpA-like domain-containing protein n=1 Tax=Paracoccus methylarcula TaxID=72022 RepID=A0A422QVN5_9RHOB|nr:thermonuclease family protein [Paracoccus methylarcula]RNF34004.1 hypothetical protein A7A09_013960 [Paracoccus methylarcula]